MKKAIFAMVFVCLMAGISQAHAGNALVCFNEQDISLIEGKLKPQRGLTLDDLFDDGRCVFIRYDSYSILKRKESHTKRIWYVGDGSVEGWTAWD